MTPLYTYNGKLLVKDNKLATSSDCCCDSGCVCATDQWRLMENGNRIDGDSIVNGGMVNANLTWEPYWYLEPGNITYTLEVHCQDEWIEIDSWERNISLCLGDEARLCDALDFALPYNLGVEAPNCGDCPCLLGVNGVGTREAYVFLASVDEEWSNLLNWEDTNGISPARSYPTPASTIIIYATLLKNSFDSQPVLTLINVGSDTDNISGKVGISLTGPANFYFESELLEEGNCDRWPDILTSYKGGYILGNCQFNQATLLSGQVVGDVEMNDNSSITLPGEVYGLGTFNENSTHHGYLKGAANFYSYSKCVGGMVCGNVTMHDNSEFGTIANGGATISCTPGFTPLETDTCSYDLILLECSHANNATVCRDTYITGPSTDLNCPSFENSTTDRDLFLAGPNGIARQCTVGRDFFMSGGHTSQDINVVGHVTTTGGYFGASSKIQSGPAGAVLNFTASLTDTKISGASYSTDTTTSTIFGNATLLNSENNGIITGNVTFTGSRNNTSGIVNGNATFLTTSLNNGTIDQDAAFYNTSKNQSGSTVGGDAVFYGTSNNDGQVTGSMFFYDSSNNDATITKSPTFDGNSDNSGTITGNPIFNGDSTNTGTIIGNPTFNGNSTNSGTISGNATFNDTSDQLGTVSGTTTCNTSGTCP